MEALLKEALNHMREFTRRVDAGEVRSVKTYAAFKVFIAKAETELAGHLSDNSLGNMIGCFDAALSEGLETALAETQDERLKDLVERRLMVGYRDAVGPWHQSTAFQQGSA